MLGEDFLELRLKHTVCCIFLVMDFIYKGGISHVLGMIRGLKPLRERLRAFSNGRSRWELEESSGFFMNLAEKKTPMLERSNESLCLTGGTNLVQVLLMQTSIAS